MIDLLSPILTAAELERYGPSLRGSDDGLITRCLESAPWGSATAIDLAGCDAQAIRDPRSIERFVIAMAAAGTPSRS